MIEVENSSSVKQVNQDSGSSVSDELNQDELMDMNQQLKGKRNGRFVRLTPQMESIYKEALMNVIFGQFTQANSKLKHLITSNPDNPQPYHLMGTMYQETGDLKKAVEYYFISTYLAPPNFQKWVKVADMSMILKMHSQAAYCYGRALKIDNYNIQLSLKRAQAFQLSNQDRKAITMYKRILKITKSQNAIKRYAKLRFKRGQFQKARQILSVICIKNQNFTKQQKNQENLINGYDLNVVYMICQTYLKQMNYVQLANFIKQKILTLNINPNSSQNEQENYKINLDDIPLQFIRMLYLCNHANLSINIPEIDFQQLQKAFYENYQPNDANHYEQIAKHLQRINSQQSFKLLKWLIQLQEVDKHKTVDNFLILSEYLKKKDKIKQAQKFVKMGLIFHPHSTGLKIQLSHLRVFENQKHQEKSYQETYQKTRKKYSDQEYLIEQQKDQIKNKNQISKSFKNQKNVNFKSKYKSKYAEDDDDMIFEESVEQGDKNMLQELPSEILLINEQQDQSNENKNKGNIRKSTKKLNKQKKTKKNIKDHIQTRDYQIIQKLLQNTNETMEKILQKLAFEQKQIQKSKQIWKDKQQSDDFEDFLQEKPETQNKKKKLNNKKYSYPSKSSSLKYYKDVYKSIQLIVELSQSTKNQNTSSILNNLNANNSILSIQNHLVKRRSSASNLLINKSAIFEHKYEYNSPKINLRNHQANRFINQNKELISQVIQKIIQYQIILLKERNYKKVTLLAEQLVKSRFLKRHLRNQTLIALKIRVYEVALLACMHLKKYAKALYFMRYLINKNPENKFYVLLLGYFARNIPKKNCLVPILKKYISKEAKQGQQLFRYLLGLQHLQTSEYQISLNLFLGILQSKNLRIQQKNKIYLISAISLLQIASSRNTYDKLDFVNRSAFFMKKYVETCQQLNQFKGPQLNKNPYIYFNMGRWYSHLKINQKAIKEYQKVLQIQFQDINDKIKEQQLKRIKKKSALCLMIIYKELNIQNKVQQLSQKYFSMESFVNQQKIMVQKKQDQQLQEQKDLEQIFNEQDEHQQ